MNKKFLHSVGVLVLTLGPLVVSSQSASANDIQQQIDSVNQQMGQTQYLSQEWLALYNQKGELQIQLQVCTRDNTCGGSTTTTPSPASSSTPTSTPNQSSTPSPSVSSSPASSPSPDTSASPNSSPISNAPESPGQTAAPLLTYDEYVKQVQAIDSKLVSSTGSERQSLLNQKNAIVVQYQADTVKAQQKYVAVQQEYVKQLAVITSKNQAEAQAKLIEVAKQEALSAGVNSNQLSSWTAVQTDLQQKVAQLEQVISSYEAIYTAESIASMNLDTVDQTVTKAVAYQQELKQQSLTLSSVAMDSLSKVSAASLTTSQKNILASAASISFEYAAQGSPVYNQALDSMFTIAESDDPTLNPGIAEIPLLGSALQSVLESFNYLGNVGSDMSPQVRDQSEKVVVSAVIVGQVTQLAVGASTLSTSVMVGSSPVSIRRL